MPRWHKHLVRERQDLGMRTTLPETCSASDSITYSTMAPGSIAYSSVADRSPSAHSSTLSLAMLWVQDNNLLF